jgi:hypothetical protein
MNPNLNNLTRFGGGIAILAIVVSAISFNLKEAEDGTSQNTPKTPKTIESSPLPQAIALASKEFEPTAPPMLSLQERQQIIRAIEAKNKARESPQPRLTPAGGRIDPARQEQRRLERETNPDTSRFAAIEDIYHDIGGAILEQGSQRFNRIMDSIHDTDMKDELSSVDSVFLTEGEKEVYDATYSAGEPKPSTVKAIGDWLQLRFEQAQMEQAEVNPRDSKRWSEKIQWLESAAEQLRIPLEPNDSEWENVALTHISEIAQENDLFHAATDPVSVAVINGDVLELERLVNDIEDNLGK